MPKPATHRLTKTERLADPAAFKRAFDLRASAADGRMVVYCAANGLAWSRLGIRIGRKYGNSPDRNRFKRLVREAFRLHKAEFPAGYDVVVTPRLSKPEPVAKGGQGAKGTKGNKPGKKNQRTAPKPARIALADIAGSLPELIRQAARRADRSPASALASGGRKPPVDEKPKGRGSRKSRPAQGQGRSRPPTPEGPS